MPIFHLIDYINSYAKTSRRLWQCHDYDSNDKITDSGSFELKEKITRGTPAASNTKDVDKVVP